LAAAFAHLCVSAAPVGLLSMQFVCCRNFGLFLPQILKSGDVGLGCFMEYQILQIFLETKSNLVSFSEKHSCEGKQKWPESTS